MFLSHSPFYIVDHGVEAEKQRKGKQSFVYPPCLESLRDDETGNEKYPQGDRRERLVFWDFCDRNLWLHEGMGREGEREGPELAMVEMLLTGVSLSSVAFASHC